MRILRVISTMNPKYGGPVEGVKQMNRFLQMDGHHVEVACVDDPESPWLPSLPFPVHALGPGAGAYAFSKQLIPWLKQNAPLFDCVIVHGIWDYSGNAAWKALHKSSTPYFVYTHGMLDPWFRKAFPLKHIKKSIYWHLILYKVLRDARAVFFTSEEERILARQSFWPYRCHELVVNYGTSIPAGDPVAQRQAFLEKFPELAGRRLLLFLSRIHPKKGCDILIEAFAKTRDLDPNLHLVIAGPDELGWESRLKESAQELGVADRITWAGMLVNDLKWGAYHSADLFVLPSHSENFGIVVAEALACGLPVLTTNKVNIWREIEESGAGFITDVNQESVAAALRTWLEMPATERDAKRVKASECFEKHFRIENAAKQLVALLEKNGVPVGSGSAITPS